MSEKTIKEAINTLRFCLRKAKNKEPIEAIALLRELLLERVEQMQNRGALYLDELDSIDFLMDFLDSELDEKIKEWSK